jgi:pimeloyl-ACP methyl ester carboxylesterase
MRTPVLGQPMVRNRRGSMESGSPRSIPLDGGRRSLGYVEYGDPDGQPVLFFHGFPGSHVQGRAFDQPAAAHRIRVVAVDRPGMGLSPSDGRRRLVDWAGDVATLADALRLDRFAVVGVSGGGPYAACCAYAIPERLTGVALVSSVAPTDPAASLEGLAEVHRRRYEGLLKLRRFPVLTRLVAAQMARRARRVGWLAVVRESMSAVDQERIDASPELAQALEDSFREAFRRGSKGFASDLRVIFAQPWGFRLDEIAVPVQLWHGECDDNVPVADGYRVAAEIPECHATFVVDAGHMLFIDRAAEILTATTP